MDHLAQWPPSTTTQFHLFDLRPQWDSWLNGLQEPPLNLLPCQLPRSGLRYDMATKERSACNAKEHDSFEII